VCAGKPSQYVTSHLGQLSLLSIYIYIYIVYKYPSGAGRSSAGWFGWG